MPKRSPSKKKERIREKSEEEKEVTSPPGNSRKRIPRACDRCKIKKSKCDGGVPCETCAASGNECRYSARRRREARDFFLLYRDVYEQALQRLYWACRQKTGFPGVVPDESKGHVTTEEILRGMGLWGDDLEVESDERLMGEATPTIPSPLRLNSAGLTGFHELGRNISSQSSPGSIPTNISSMEDNRYFDSDGVFSAGVRYDKQGMQDGEVEDGTNMMPLRSDGPFSQYLALGQWQKTRYGRSDQGQMGPTQNGMNTDTRRGLMPMSMVNQSETMVDGSESHTDSDYMMNSYAMQNNNMEYPSLGPKQRDLHFAGPQSRRDGMMVNWSERQGLMDNNEISKGKRRER